MADKASKSNNGTVFSATTDLGACRRVLEANLNSYKGKGEDGKAKTFTKDELTAAGLQTHAEAVSVSFSYNDARYNVNDAKDLPSLLAGVERVYNEMSRIKSAIVANGNASLGITNKKGETSVVPDPTLGKSEDGVDPICAHIIDMYRSGQALAWAQILGKPMRDAAEAKLGKVGATSTSKAADVV